MPAIPTGKLERFLIGEPAWLTLLPVDANDAPLVVTAPALISILDGAGEVVVEKDEATVTEDGASITYQLDPDDFAAYDSYSVVWTANVGDTPRSWESVLELCGGHVFSIATFRVWARGTGVDTKPASEIRDARRRAEDRFEGLARVAFVPRGARARLTGDGTPTLLLPHVELREVYAAELDEVKLTAEELAAFGPDASGAVRRASTVWPDGACINIHYAHGYDRPPSPVVDAIIELADEALTESGLPRRATSISTDVGAYRISTAGRDGPTGLPNVDAALEEYGRRRPTVG